MPLQCLQCPGRAPPHGRSSAPRRPSRRAGGRSTGTPHSPLGTRPPDCSSGSWRRIACSSAASSAHGSRPSSAASSSRAAADGGQRVRLAPLAVLRQAEDDPATLAHRRFGDAGARLSGDLEQLTRLEPRLQQRLLRRRGGSPPADTTRSAQAPNRAVRRRAAPPQRERLRERVRRTIGLAQLEQLRTPRDEPFESLPASRSTPLRRRAGIPSGVVSIRAGAIRRRSRMMQPGITFDHEAGGSSPQRAVARDLTDTAHPGARERSQHEAITRGEAIRPSSSVSAPRTRRSMGPLCPRLSLPSRRLMSGRHNNVERRVGGSETKVSEPPTRVPKVSGAQPPHIIRGGLVLALAAERLDGLADVRQSEGVLRVDGLVDPPKQAASAGAALAAPAKPKTARATMDPMARMRFIGLSLLSAGACSPDTMYFSSRRGFGCTSSRKLRPDDPLALGRDRVEVAAGWR